MLRERERSKIECIGKELEWYVDDACLHNNGVNGKFECKTKMRMKW